MPKTKYAEKVYQAVGARIADRRRGRLTQDELAKLTDGGLSRSALANIERGRQRLAVHQLYLIAGALGVQPAELLPTLDSASGHRAAIPEDPEALAWISKVIGKAIEPEKEGSDAQTKSD